MTNFPEQIRIYANIDSFRFELDDKSIVLKTSVFVEQKDGESIISSIGELPKGKRNTSEIRLFEENARHNKWDAATAFISYGIKSVLSRRAIVRPTVVFFGIRHFRVLMSGYEEGVILRICEDAGAIKVVFK